MINRHLKSLVHCYQCAFSRGKYLYFNFYLMTLRSTIIIDDDAFGQRSDFVALGE